MSLDAKIDQPLKRTPTPTEQLREAKIQEITRQLDALVLNLRIKNDEEYLAKAIWRMDPGKREILLNATDNAKAEIQSEYLRNLRDGEAVD